MDYYIYVYITNSVCKFSAIDDKQHLFEKRTIRPYYMQNKLLKRVSLCG